MDKAQWSIKTNGIRTAQIGKLLAVVGKPVKGSDLPWIVLDENGQQAVAGSTSYSAPRKYSAQVRQAEHDAEQAAAELVK